MKKDYRNKKNTTDKRQIKRIKQDWRIIRKIKNPSEKVQMEAVRQNELALEYI